MLLVFPVWVLYGTVIIFGLILGSYLNSWMWRVHEREENESDSLPPAAHTPLPRSQRGMPLPGRSLCIHCQRQLAWFENIPLISFIALGGKCKTCKQAIPIDYFLVELGTALVMLVVVYLDVTRGVVNTWHIWRDLFFAALLVVVFIYDLKYYLIISGVVYAGAIIAFLVNHFALQFSTYSLVLGGVVGGGFFMLQYVLSRGRWIGGGDVRLGLMMGVLLGWPHILVALFVSYVLGAIVAVPLLIMKKKGMKSEIPFGTFLAVGTLVALFRGGQIINWYWGMMRW